MRFLFLPLLLSPMAASAIVIANYTDDENLRFHDDPAFIGNPYDLSGLGRTSISADGSVNKEWATLIGDNYFISAVHYHPSTGDTITFTDGNSPSDPTYSYVVAGGFNVPGTDFRIGYTDVSINSSLKRYSITTIPADTLADLGLSGSSLFVNGDDVPGGPGGLTNHIVGTNQAESWLESGTNTVSLPETNITFSSNATFDQLVTFENLSGDTSNTFTTHEGQVQSGDSGSPLFNISGGNLEIVGIGYAILTNIEANFIDTNGPAGGLQDPLESRNLSFYSYPGSYETEINTAIAMVPAAIPEPSTVILLLLSSLSILRRSR